MAKSKTFRFNIKNVKYAVLTAGTYGTPVELAYAKSISLEAKYDETTLYGDGVALAILGDDKGKTGTLGVTNIEKTYEIAMKRALEITGGLADVQQFESVEHALYFEIEAIENNAKVTYKNWLFGVRTGKANEAYAQTEDKPTINGYEYSLTVLGTYLKATGGSTDYVDTNGNKLKVYRVMSVPTDVGYATFDATVPVPTAKAA